jgi:hypothetical protein
MIFRRLTAKPLQQAPSTKKKKEKETHIQAQHRIRSFRVFDLAGYERMLA